MCKILIVIDVLSTQSGWLGQREEGGHLVREHAQRQPRPLLHRRHRQAHDQKGKLTVRIPLVVGRFALPEMPYFFSAGRGERARPGGGGGGRAAVPAPAAAVPAAGRRPAARLRNDLGAEDARPEKRRVTGRAGVPQKGEG